MRKIPLIICIFTCLYGTNQIARCTPIYNPASGNLYYSVSAGAESSYIHPENNTFVLDGNLVIIEDTAEESLLTENFENRTIFQTSLKDAVFRRNWIWSRDEPAGYISHNQIESDNAILLTGRNYTGLNWDISAHQWTDSNFELPEYSRMDGFVQVMPALGVILFGSIGVGLVSWLRKRIMF